MAEQFANSMRIDLNQFKLHLSIDSSVEMTLHFNSSSRRFYLSVIALIVHEMKKRGRIASIPLQKHIDVLELLNESIGGGAGSSKPQHLLPRIYRKWKDALPDLENAPLFKVVGRKKRYDELTGSVYGFSESAKDSWANLFEYKGSNEQVRLRFSIDRLDMSLDDVIIEDGNDSPSKNFDAWEAFLTHLQLKYADKSNPSSNAVVPEAESRPDGYEKGARRSLKKWQWMAFLIMVGVISTTATVTMWNHLVHSSKKPGSTVDNFASLLPEKPSIAVLPFDNLSGDPKEEYFCDGISDDLITDLSKIPKIYVISRLSSSIYKGKIIRIEQIAKELNVDYVVEGSVQKNGDEVRINAQLIDAASGHHLWAERYDGDMRDLFALQDKITRKIAASLAIVLTDDDHESIVQKESTDMKAYEAFLRGADLPKVDDERYAKIETDNIEAYEVYLKGADLSNRLRFDPEGLAKSIAWFERAISLDPNYSRAYAALAETYRLGAPHRKFRHQLGISYRLANLRWLHYLEFAMENPSNIAYRNIARMHLNQFQHEKAIAECMQALTLEPNDPTSNGFMAATLIFSGMPEEAYPFIERMRRADPACLF